MDLARWLHPEFAVMMDGWFLESFTPKLAADPNPAPAALPPQQRELLEYQVGGPGINVLGATAFLEPLSQILDAYTTQTEAEQQALPQPERCRSLRYPRPGAKHFLEWFVAKHGQLVISPTPVGIPVGAVACPPRPPAPPVPAAGPPGSRRHHHHQPARARHPAAAAHPRRGPLCPGGREQGRGGSG